MPITAAMTVPCDHCGAPIEGASVMDRSDLVRQVLTAYAVKKQRQASLIAKAPTINPPPADSRWSDL